jgi:hypothetical protein
MEILKPAISTGYFGPNLITDVNLTKFALGDIYVDRSFKLQITDLVGYGFNNFKIEKLRINPEDFKVCQLISVESINYCLLHSS